MIWFWLETLSLLGTRELHLRLLPLAPYAPSLTPSPTVSQMLDLMLSDSGGRQSTRQTARHNLVNLLLFLVDWVQLMAIMVSAKTGYDFP